MNYTTSSKILHHIVLGNSFIMKSLFNMEIENYGKNFKETINRNHVFISGLARSGTTILLQHLYHSGEFISLTYNEMPFVVAPNFWRKMKNQKNETAKPEERSHGDGILVNEDSPEALDEVFWKLFLGKKYIMNDKLVTHDVNDEIIELYQKYIHSVLQIKKGENVRYLSKNNNNILRLKAITKAFPESVVIVPFRNPLDHAMSLMNQHLRFTERNLHDSFSRSYMKWLGHHEFGTDHKPFFFPFNEMFDLKNFKTNELNYWLASWYNYYKYLIVSNLKNIYFFNFEKLCSEPYDSMNYIAKITKVKINSDKILPFNQPERKPENYDNSLLNICNEIFNDMLRISTLNGQ